MSAEGRRFPPLLSILLYYGNPAIFLLAFIGYFGPQIAREFHILLPLALLVVWTPFGIATAACQAAVAGWRLIRGEDSRNWHHVFSAGLVTVLLGTGMVLHKFGYYLTA